MVEETELDEEEVLWEPEKSESVRYIEDLVACQQNFVSPINLNIAEMIQICLPPLTFYHQDVECKKMKCLNSGHTLIVSARWKTERPYITGGPLLGNYVFSQLHFHWGACDLEGSEHTIDGTQYPVEMHVVYFKSCYLTQEAALRERDGVVIIAYICKSHPNPDMQVLLNSAKLVYRAGLAVRMDQLALYDIFRPFENDYFTYWGSIVTSADSHIILWIICREPIGISVKQAQTFRKFLDEEDKPIIQNYRYVQDAGSKPVYHVNPSSMQFATLLPIQKYFKRIKMPKSSSKDRV